MTLPPPIFCGWCPPRRDVNIAVVLMSVTFSGPPDAGTAVQAERPACDACALVYAAGADAAGAAVGSVVITALPVRDAVPAVGDQQ